MRVRSEHLSGDSTEGTVDPPVVYILRRLRPKGGDPALPRDWPVLPVQVWVHLQAAVLDKSPVVHSAGWNAYPGTKYVSLILVVGSRALLGRPTSFESRSNVAWR